MTLKQNRHACSRKGELADFIRWLDQNYEFGGWTDHMRAIGALMRGPGKLLVRYDDFAASPDVLRRIVDFVDPDHGLSIERIQATFDWKSNIFEGIGANPHARDQWGIGAEFPPDSLFYEWSQNRQGSHWHAAWDMAAKQAFHETGATEFLLEYGFETDPDWWKQDTASWR